MPGLAAQVQEYRGQSLLEDLRNVHDAFITHSHTGHGLVSTDSRLEDKQIVTWGSMAL